MNKSITILFCLFLGLAVTSVWENTASAQNSTSIVRDSITIISPKNEDSVQVKPLVKGTVTIPNSIVWVIVHPMETADYWVQQSGTSRNNGSWNCIINIGRPGNQDVKQYFEIRAVVNPNMALSNGVKLATWPKAGIQSDIITVIRK